MSDPSSRPSIWTPLPGLSRNPRSRRQQSRTLACVAGSFLFGFLVGFWADRVVESAPWKDQAANKFVTLHTLKAIKPGMTFTEVQELLGDDGTPVDAENAADNSIPVSQFARIWENGDRSITIFFDAPGTTGKVVGRRAKRLE